MFSQLGLFEFVHTFLPVAGDVPHIQGVRVPRPRAERGRGHQLPEACACGGSVRTAAGRE